MKIGLFGYGKMGRMIDRLATARGHQVVARIDGPADQIPFDQMDVAIDFSQPGAAVENISQCLQNGVPVISGTTGWLADFDKVTELCQARDGAFLYASNFSLGVNLFFELNRYLSRLMSGVQGYSVHITEIHHSGKKDAPSGTAISLAEGIIENSDYHSWSPDAKGSGNIPIVSERTGDIPGTHRIAYDSEVDRIEIRHSAHSREGFAQGALLAAEWLVGKKGVFGMKDVLNLR
ncbi:MAG: 4-hydroxy-tetrahydrodipicolinate reductase [Robiginitalea sp.]